VVNVSAKTLITDSHTNKQSREINNFKGERKERRIKGIAPGLARGGGLKPRYPPGCCGSLGVWVRS
jgi:hypothetical protein